MKIIKKTTLLLVLCLTLSACTSQSDTDITLHEPVEVQYDTAVATRMDMSRRRQYEAYVKAEIEEVSFEKRSGKLGEFYVSLGDSVSEGDPIAALDVTDLQDQIAAASDELDYKLSKTAYDLRQKQYDIELAELDLEALIIAGASQADIDIAEISIEKLKAEAKYIEKNGEIEIEQAEKKLNDLKQSLEGTVVYAPCDGEVVFLEPISPGSRIPANTAICYIADKSRMYVQYDGTDSISSDARTTALIGGKEYSIVKDEYDRQEYIALMLSGIRPPTIFYFSEDYTDVTAGDFAAVIVHEREKLDVLSVPVNAVFNNAGEYYVYRIEDGEKIYTSVECGLITDSFTEITAGLEEGDVVFVRQ